MLDFSNSREEELKWAVANKKGVQTFIKRDDLIHPVVSGNKWRKLHLIFEQAIKDKKTEIITFGGAYSNHLLATACAGNMYGIKTRGVVRGEEIKTLNLQLSLCKRYGMNLTFVSRTEYKDKKSLSEKFTSKNNLVIDEGGRHPLAIEGVRTIIQELQRQYDYLILPVGTGTTLEGIAEEIKDTNLATGIIAFSALKENQEDKSRLNHLLDIIDWKDETEFGGYGKFNLELIQFMNDFTKQTGVLIDPIYQGKMYFGLAKLIEGNHFNPGSKILCIQTGGNLGLYTKKVAKLIS
jgi:1-aminocyclopropane-1-carboxylate deaminase